MQNKDMVLKGGIDGTVSEVVEDDLLSKISVNYTEEDFKLSKNSIMIVPNDIKMQVIKKFHADLNNAKIMTLKEWKNKFYFTYNEHAVYYLMKKYHYCYDVAVMYLERMYEVVNEDFGSLKIEKVIKLKKELSSEGLLINSSNFRKYLKGKEIIFYDFNSIGNNEKKVIRDVMAFSKVSVVNLNKEEYQHEAIYEFGTIEDEVRFVAEEICKLNKGGVDFNNIKLCGVVGEYTSLIDRIFSWYHIPIVFQDNYLYSTSIGQAFLKYLDEDGSGALKYIEDNYSLTNRNNLNIYNKIIQILNKYVWAESYLEVREFLENEFKGTLVNEVSYLEEVSVISSLSLVGDDYVFLMGFNQGDIPKTVKDEEYFNDVLKQKLGLETTNELNQRMYLKWLQDIKTTKNLIISTKLTSSLGEHYLSSLNDDLGLEVKRVGIDYSYSNLDNKLLLGEKIDTFIKYGEKAEDLELLYSNYLSLPYQEYSNEFEGIDVTKLHDYMKNKLVLSYSAMNTYYQCGFRYYLANVLKLNIFEETFYTVLGNLFHYILSIAFDREIDLHEEYNKYLDKCTYPFNSREKFFLNMLESELDFIINTIKKQNEVNSLKNNYYEEKIVVDKSKNDMDIVFKGFVDKLMTNDREDTIAIVDYKTGNPDLNLNHIIYGLDLQLPVYIYLARQKSPNANIAGFYLQKILNNEISKDYKHTYQALKEDKLKLQGYSNSSIPILEKFDGGYQESKMIKGMRTTSKGLGTKKVLNNEQIDELENITKQKIDEAIDNILGANFSINPKRVGMNNLGCKYCQFRDICFVNEENILNLKEYKKMEFLGGESNDTEETC